MDDLKEMNESLQVRDYQPEYMAIEDDSGGLVFLIKQKKDAKEVFIVDICGYDLETAYYKINDLQSWFDQGYGKDKKGICNGYRFIRAIKAIKRAAL